MRGICLRYCYLHVSICALPFGQGGGPRKRSAKFDPSDDSVWSDFIYFKHNGDVAGLGHLYSYLYARLVFRVFVLADVPAKRAPGHSVLLFSNRDWSIY